MCIKSYPHQHINLLIHGLNLAVSLCLHAFILELKVFEQVEYDLHGVGLKWDQEGKCLI